MKAMKSIFTVMTIALLAISHGAFAQNDAENQMKQAENQLANQKYTDARANYLQAYNAYTKQGDYARAVECGVQACALYHRENLYKEAFDLLRGIDQVVYAGAKKNGKAMPDLQYRITKERFGMYVNLHSDQRAKTQLNRLGELAEDTGNDSIQNDFLHNQAYYYYTFGQYKQGDAVVSKLLGRYNEKKQYDKAKDCYLMLINTARNAGNASLVAHTYHRYKMWNDSISQIAAQDNLKALQQKYDASLQTIEEKDSSIGTKQTVIVGLCILAAILVAALALGTAVALRFTAIIRKQKKAIATAREHNELKTSFIQNIAAQMEPALLTLDAKQPGVQALRGFNAHIRQLSQLEQTIDEPLEMTEVNVTNFCDALADKMKGELNKEVALTVNAPKLSVKINPEHVEYVLMHLLKNAATYTPAGGKIWLDFKKRGAHTHLFMVSDTGCGISPELQDSIFKPFAGVIDITQGDGLGLPICALMATKMNGSLTLDSNYSKGARFVLELHG